LNRHAHGALYIEATQGLASGHCLEDYLEDYLEDCLEDYLGDYLGAYLGEYLLIFGQEGPIGTFC